MFNPCSPKFDEVQLFGVITLKEQSQKSKHDKMSQLVKKMFDQQLVSPRSYETRISSLNQKYEEENQALETFKRQAEQMTSMLSEIKKDKGEIQEIDELIRLEKWEEARRLVEDTQVPFTVQELAEAEHEGEEREKLQLQAEREA